MYYLLFYSIVEQYVEKRAPYREAHLIYATEAHERGDLIMGGALGDPVDQAVLLFQGESPAVAEDFAAGDPYVRAGLVAEWQVRPWTIVVGGAGTK